MKKVLKRSLSLLLAITIIFGSAYVGLSEVDFDGLFAVEAKAATSGTTGECTWEVYESIGPDTYTVVEKTLVISGNGAMGNYDWACNLPWGNDFSAVIIKDGVTSIGDYAFWACSSLESITIPDSVTSIGYAAFYCTSLTSIKIPNSVTSIDDYAFYGCSSLESITISDSLTNIACGAFNYCSSLTSVTIPDSVTSIWQSAFEGCTSLTSITIPDSVTSIGDRAFNDCDGLKDVYYGGSRIQRYRIDISIYGYNDDLTSAKWHYAIPDTPKVKAVNTINGMNVTWNAVDGAVKYALYKRLGTANSWTYVTTTTGTSYADNNTPSAGSYYVYTVKAYNSAGTLSDYIKANCASVQRVVAPVTKAVNATNGVSVTWNKVAGANKYVVLRRIGTESTWKTICTTTSTSYIDKNVKSGTYYIYSIRAINNTGYSAYDINKRFNIQRVDTPTAVTTNLVNGVQVKWGKISGAAKYNVYRRMAGTSTWVLVGTTTSASLVDKNVVNGKYYAYSIRAINNTGYSAFDTKKTDTIQPITAPTAKVANKSSGVQVNWNSVSGAAKYTIYRRTAGSSTWVYVGQTTGISLIDTGVVKGNYYAYSIRAINGTGYSAYDSSKCAAIKYS